MKMTGYIGKAIISKGNRTFENYFINGRYIKSNILSKAIEAGYKFILMQHKYPFTVLNFEINPEYLDVNVHPSKMELRFRKGESIYPWVEECINNALIEKPNIIDVELEKDVQTQYKDIILNAIKLIGIEKLRPLKDALPEQVTYFDIHYYIIKYNNNDI